MTSTDVALMNPETSEAVRHGGLPGRMSPSEVKAQADELREVMRSVLVKDTDYGVIQGTSKPSLYKSGAEWLLKWSRFGHRMEPVEVERDEHGRKWGITYRCVVHLLDDPSVIVSSCDAYASYDEDRYYQTVEELEAKERANAERYQRKAKPEKWAEPYKAPWNTIMKMAEKRALVGATLQACAASGLFTQDVEDLPARGTASAAHEEPDEEPTLTDEQVAAFKVRASALPQAARASLTEAWNKPKQTQGGEQRAPFLPKLDECTTRHVRKIEALLSSFEQRARKGEWGEWTEGAADNAQAAPAAPTEAPASTDTPQPPSEPQGEAQGPLPCSLCGSTRAQTTEHEGVLRCVNANDCKARAEASMERLRTTLDSMSTAQMAAYTGRVKASGLNSDMLTQAVHRAAAIALAEAVLVDVPAEAPQAAEPKQRELV